MEKRRRRSRKREAILDTIRKTKEHPSAEWVYLELKDRYPNLSLGTVYRNIAEFQQAGEILRIATVNGMDRYDADTSNHSHFICEGCGSIMDVAVAVGGDFIKTAEEATGARIDHVRLSFSGLCPQCDSKKAVDTLLE